MVSEWERRLRRLWMHVPRRCSPQSIFCRWSKIAPNRPRKNLAPSARSCDSQIMSRMDDGVDLPAGAHERRRERSADAGTALQCLLESTRCKNGLPVIAVADEAGLLVAGAGAFDACEELAAFAPLLAAPPPANDTVPTRLDVLARRTAVRRIRVDGIEVLICGQGDSPARELALAAVAAGCQRILGSPTLS